MNPFGLILRWIDRRIDKRISEQASGKRAMKDLAERVTRREAEVASLAKNSKY